VTFKIDENLPKDAAELLRNHGFDAETVREENLAGAGDDIIAATIERENRVLITLDLDFSDIRTYPPQRYSGIVVLRPKAQDKIAIMALLRRLLKALETTARTRRSGLSSPIEFGIADDASGIQWNRIVTNNVCIRPFFLALGLLICAPLSQAVSRFDGTWRGTYNSQPTELLPDGSYPEKVNEYELRLHESNGTVTGEFQRRGSKSGASRTLMNGKLSGGRACFDILADDDDMRWCVIVRGNNLTGAWSLGPEGGPLLRGAGPGARLFRISGSKVAR
jgi:predicted nuclease of predicted toxin-antitoxin system